MPILTIEFGDEVSGMAADALMPLLIRHGMPAWPPLSAGDPDEDDFEEDEEDGDEDDLEDDEEEEDDLEEDEEFEEEDEEDEEEE